jgi:hypothetical protein
VNALAKAGTDLYAGGNFTLAGGVSAKFIARWNGATWSPLGAGMNTNVMALGISGGTVYAGGTFTNAGGIPATRIAKWNGSSWSAFGTGANDTVQKICVQGTNVYAGGLFTTIDDALLNHVGVWNGTKWSALERRNQSNGASFQVRALAADGTNIYAGGLFTGIGKAVGRLAKWDGANWTPVGGSILGTNIGSGTSITAIAVNGNNVYIGGSFTNAGGVTVNNIARWNGTTWSALGSGIFGSVSAIAVTNNQVYVGGTFQNAGGITAFNIAKWDGANWSELPGAGFFGNVNNFLVSAIVLSGTKVYVGGAFTASGFSSGSSTHIAYNDGTDWFPLGTGVNSNVTAIAIIGTDVYAGGRFTSASGTSASRIAKWNGTSWSALGSGTIGSSTTFLNVSALAAVGTNLYAAGGFTNVGGVTVSRVAKWNGSSWSALGSGIERAGGGAAVGVLVSSGNDLYAGGIFEAAGTKPAQNIARWNDQLSFYPPPLIKLTSPIKLPNGQFQFHFSGTSGENYIIQGSTNLVNWVPLLTNSATALDFVDTNAAGFGRRFYRVSVP